MTVKAYLIQSSLSCLSPMLPKAQHRWDRKQRQLNSHTSVLQQVNWGASNEETDSGPEDIKLSGSRARKVLVGKQFHLICHPVERLSLPGASHPELWGHLHVGDGKNWEQASHMSSWFTLAGNGVSDVLTDSRQGGIERRGVMRRPQSVARDDLFGRQS